MLVTLAPMEQVVLRLAGDAVEVESFVPAGADVETFAPTPRQMAALARADLLFEVGHPGVLLESRQIDPFLARHPEIARLRLADVGAPLADPDDPHLWLSPRRMRAAAAALADLLARRLPADAEAIAARARELDGEIAALDRDLTARFAAAKGRAFLVFHPALGAFAADYGLEQVAIEREGKEPSPTWLARTLEWARAAGVRVVLVQRGKPTRAAAVVAGELGARTVEIDPLDADWLGGVRRTAEAVEEALVGG
ncbi:MAG: zinc ABC transporter substrate-binding protein [Acidobacteria bacterium]|nr:zinc ABC transporter substrate-binding protein [Acidobacteriota bacterium]